VGSNGWARLHQKRAEAVAHYINDPAKVVLGRKQRQEL